MLTTCSHVLTCKRGYDFFLLTLGFHCLAETEEDVSQRNTIPLTLRMRAATATAVGAAAAHAQLLADQEEREVEYLVSTLVEAQVSLWFRLC